MNQQCNHHQLRQGHEPAGHAGRLVNAQLHRQGANAHLTVTGHRLEVVERHDAVRGGAVECRQNQ